MHVFRSQEQENAGLVGWGVRVLLLTPEDRGPLASRIAGFGGRVDTETEMYAALSALIDDPAGWSVFVMECDSYGGLEAARRATSMLGTVAERLAIILISAECDRQVFPEDRRAPIVLRGPASAVSLRVGFEHALRDRIAWRAA
jgi:hypothetical protein